MATGFNVMDALNKNSKAGVDESPKARFRTKDISIHKIYSNSLNFYPQEGIEEKVGEILSVGLLENLAVMYEPCEKGEYKLISGERRWRALKHLTEKGYKEFEMVTCQIRTPKNEYEEKIEIIIANSTRIKTTATLIREEQELKYTLEYMKENGIELKGYDLQKGRLREVIANMLRVSKTKVAQIDSVSNNLIPEWKEELDKSRLTFSAAYELSGMTSDQQQEALEKYKETGELSHKEVKVMKDAKAAGTKKDDEQQDMKSVSESDTGEKTASEEYQTPHPVGITSLCYSCTEYETCNVKTGTCTTCDQYKNRTEAYKTDEQRYSEEQDAIDRETKRKLREMADNEKIATLPSDAGDGRKAHTVKLVYTYFDDVVSGKKPFELRKNDRDYKEGDILEMMEFKDGNYTGRSIKVIVTYLMKEYTGIVDGYCIMGTKIVGVAGVDMAAGES
jgi:ParB family chromosome partitioning protein